MIAINRSVRLAILAVATEWNPYNGGLSTLNRNLCVALAQAGHRVVCLVPKTSREEIEAAAKLGVEIVEATPTTGKDVGPLACLQRKPALPKDFVPEIVLGHGRVTGSAARALVDDFFPRALRVHLLHTAPNEIEWYKLRSTDAAVRAEGDEHTEAELGRTAALAVGVGPRLTLELKNLLAPYVLPRPVHELDPGLDRVVDISSEGDAIREPPPGMHCLFLGRAEDDILKGLDIAAEAMALVRARGTQALLVVRGAAPGTGQKLQAELAARVKAPNSVRVKEFSASAQTIREDLLRSAIVLMPSRSEGFGLVGLEAIARGIPTLLSDQSGLAQLLSRRDLPELVGRVVVQVTTELSTTAEMWARRIDTELHDLAAAFRRAADVRAALASIFTWDRAAAAIIAAIGVRAPMGPKSREPHELRETEKGIATPHNAESANVGTPQQEVPLQVAVPTIRRLDPDDQYRAALEHTAVALRFVDWDSWMSNFTTNGRPSIHKEALKSMDDIVLWLLRRPWPGTRPELEKAFQNLRRVAHDLVRVFNSYAKTDDSDKIWTREFYYDQLHDSEDDELDIAYEAHVGLVQDLAAELTRAANWLCEVARATVDPSFWLDHGWLTITSGPTDTLQFETFVVRYRGTDDWVNGMPYTGLREFLELRATRDRNWGEGQLPKYLRYSTISELHVTSRPIKRDQRNNSRPVQPVAKNVDEDPTRNLVGVTTKGGPPPIPPPVNNRPVEDIHREAITMWQEPADAPTGGTLRICFLPVTEASSGKDQFALRKILAAASVRRISLEYPWATRADIKNRADAIQGDVRVEGVVGLYERWLLHSSGAFISARMIPEATNSKTDRKIYLKRTFYTIVLAVMFMGRLYANMNISGDIQYEFRLSDMDGRELELDDVHPVRRYLATDADIFVRGVVSTTDLGRAWEPVAMGIGKRVVAFFDLEASDQMLQELVDRLKENQW